ncbi:geranylgeranylglycerol-phosphate geranylgeranyltransferase [Haloarchaeobius sp. TZWWS8]|uniref:geranylgeranylglycerol-phosphate geranylgeranyltransferase n=1 Tax=Haloarchaeobius sp. TZWWS8 TaxID=3446121 RepID=UPI003EBD15D1
MELRTRLRGLVELTRPGNALMAGVLTFIGAFVAIGVEAVEVGGAWDAPAIQATAAVAATVFATGAGMVINDYFDADIDRINAPDRPIPRGAVSERGALVFSILLFAGAAASAALLPPLAIGIAVVNLVALAVYTQWFKGTPGFGNLVVGYLTGSTFLFGGAAVGSPAPASVLFGLAALSTVSREIIKDIEDLAGDREEGLTTLPIAVGERTAMLIAVGALVVAVVASPVPYLRGTFGEAYLIAVLPADLVMLYAAYEGYDDPSASQNHLKYGMYLAVVAFVVGRLVVLPGGV